MLSFITANMAMPHLLNRNLRTGNRPERAAFFLIHFPFSIVGSKSSLHQRWPPGNNGELKIEKGKCCNRKWLNLRWADFVNLGCESSAGA
jgi:hypothetical protein